jgi:hypothetical protein
MVLAAGGCENVGRFRARYAGAEDACTHTVSTETSANAKRARCACQMQQMGSRRASCCWEHNVQ